MDFNEYLLEALATEGEGHFYYIAHPTQIPEVFCQELGELLTNFVCEAFLSICYADLEGHTQKATTDLALSYIYEVGIPTYFRHYIPTFSGVPAKLRC